MPLFYLGEKEMSLAVVILAAGKGTRMKSPYPKVLHLLAGEPLIIHAIEAVLPIRPDRLLVVIGHKASLVKEILKGYPVEYVIQDQQLGTGDAVKRTKPYLRGFPGNILVLCGDTPLISVRTLEDFLCFHCKQQPAVSILTAHLKDPTGYGRIVRDQFGFVKKIVEEKDASDQERKITEINTGIYIFEAQFLFEALEDLRPENIQKEYYLTDVVEIAVREGKRVAATPVSDPIEILGVNSQTELAHVEEIYQRRLRRRLMEGGVSLILPETIYIERRVKIHAGAIIYPFVVIKGITEIGPRCIVESFCYLENVIMGPCAVVEAGSVLKDFTIPPSTRIKGIFSFHSA